MSSSSPSLSSSSSPSHSPSLSPSHEDILIPSPSSPTLFSPHWVDWYSSHRVFLVFLGFLQSFLCSGIFYGWPALYTILLDNGVYSNRCETHSESGSGENNSSTDINISDICSGQKLSLGYLYSFSSSLNLCSQLFWGFILDWWGPRKCSTLATSLVAMAFIIMGITISETFSGTLEGLNSLRSLFLIDYYGIFIGVSLIGFSGPGVQISLFHLSELFPHDKSTILATLTGAFQMSFVIFLGFKISIHYEMFSVGNLFLFYSIPLILLVIIGMYLWPDSPCEFIDPDPITFSSQPHSHAAMVEAKKREREIMKSNSHHSSNGEQLIFSSAALSPSHSNSNSLLSLPSLSLHNSNPNPRGSIFSASFTSQLLSPSFLLCVLWMSSSLYWANFYIGSVSEQLWIKSEHDVQTTRTLTDIFTAVLPIGILTIPIFGKLNDYYGFGYSISLCVLTGISFGILNLISTVNIFVQSITFILYALFRSLLFSFMFSYLAHEFSYRHFGLLSGILLFAAGIIQIANLSLTTTDSEVHLNNASTSLSPSPSPSFSEFSLMNRINYFQLATFCVDSIFAIFVVKTQRKRKNASNNSNEILNGVSVSISVNEKTPLL